MKRIILYVLLVLCFKALSADEVTFKVDAPKVVELGQQFRLTYSINTVIQNFYEPDIDNFIILVGPSRSESSNISIINGKMSRTHNLQYTYILQATKEGSFTISPATIKVDGKVYKSNELEIEVIKGSSGSSGGQSAPPQGNQPGSETKTDDHVSSSDLFVKVHVSRNNIYQGEYLIATIKLYTKLNLTGLNNYDFPDFSGFFNHELEVPPLRQLEREVINGEIYGTGVLKKYVLIPQRPGDITIEPFEMDCIYQKRSSTTQRSIFDDFFGSYDRMVKRVKSNPITISVKPLPDPKPYNFSGGVGKMKLNVKVDKRQVDVNDAITMDVKVSGSGNIKIVEPLEIEFPVDFEVYDPKITENIKYGLSGPVGVKNFEYVIIPRHSGDFTIPSLSFSFFDPEEKRYKTLTSEELQVSVDRGTGDTSVTMTNAYTKEDLKFLGRDIRFIKTDTEFKHKNKFFAGSRIFYGIYTFFLLIFLFFVLLRRKFEKENANLELARYRKASKYARKRLKNAGRAMKENKKESFYEELAKALWGYLSDKLGIPLANLSLDNAREELSKKNVQEEEITAFLDILDICEYARYAPSTITKGMDEVYKDAVSVISKLQQQLR